MKMVISNNINIRNRCSRFKCAVWFLNRT